MNGRLAAVVLTSICCSAPYAWPVGVRRDELNATALLKRQELTDPVMSLMVGAVSVNARVFEDSRETAGVAKEMNGGREEATAGINSRNENAAKATGSNSLVTTSRSRFRHKHSGGQGRKMKPRDGMEYITYLGDDEAVQPNKSSITP